MRDLILLTTGHPHRQLLKPVIAVVDLEGVPPDLDHGGLEYLLESFAAEEEDITTRLSRSDILADIELVGLCVRRQYDVPGRKDEDLRAVAAFADIERSGSLDIRSGLGSDLQAECGSERTAHVGDCGEERGGIRGAEGWPGPTG